jgi:hypothetical protein
VLQTLNAPPGDLTPVFDTILEKAHALCGVEQGALVTYDGEYFRLAADRGMPQFWVKQFRQPYRAAPAFQGGRIWSTRASLTGWKGFTIIRPCRDRPSCKSSVIRKLRPIRIEVAHSRASQKEMLCALTRSSAAARSGSAAVCTGTRRASRLRADAPKRR